MLYVIFGRVIFPLYVLVALILLLSNLLFLFSGVIGLREFSRNIPFSLFWLFYLSTKPGRARMGKFLRAYTKDKAKNKWDF